MASQVMSITLKAYDHQRVDASAKKIIETGSPRTDSPTANCSLNGGR